MSVYNNLRQEMLEPSSHGKHGAESSFLYEPDHVILCERCGHFDNVCECNQGNDLVGYFSGVGAENCGKKGGKHHNYIKFPDF